MRLGKELAPINAQGRFKTRTYGSGVCLWCGSAFRARGGWHHYCGRTCQRKKTLADKYGISLAALRELGDSCALCGTTEDLHVDHCHSTGRVRGILCRQHNYGLGNFADDATMLVAAINYLESAKF